MFFKEVAINFRQLKYFVRVVEAGNMTRAADALFVAQTALSMQIRQLEDDLGVGLLVRHSRGVSPTRAGQQLYERACEVLRLIDETEREVAATGRMEHEGVVLGLTNGFMNVVARELIDLVRRELPGVRLSIAEERSAILVSMLERHEVDLALAYEVHERPGLLRVPLLEEDLLFITAPRGEAVTPTLPLQGIDLAQALAHELVLPGPRDGVRQQVLSAAKRMALQVKVQIDVSSISTIKNIVMHGDAAAVVPYSNVAEDLARGFLNARRIVNPALRRTLYLIRSRKRAAMRNESALLDLLGRCTSIYGQQLHGMATLLPALDGRLSLAVAQAADNPQRDRNEAHAAPNSR